MKYLILFVIVTMISNTALAEDCGIAPVTPVPPVGTSQCTAICMCNEDGERCHWEFSCY
jgi:hypothetical protein